MAIDFRTGRLPVTVSDNQSDKFAGRNVLVTLSRDNPLEWITEWASFHVRHHGVNGLLLFDNASSAYTLPDVETVVSSIPGLETFEVVSWPFKFGPPAKRGTSRWDSDFSKHGFLELARWKYLQSANWVLNLDIDELLIHPEKTPLANYFKSTDANHISFDGHWVFPHQSPLPELKRRCYGDSFLVDFSKPVHKKWAVRPAQAIAKQWTTHALRNLAPNQENHGFELRHFSALSTSWKYPRDSRTSGDLRPTHDEILASYF